MSWSDFDLACMDRALALAALGRGAVEPNPMVGCVLAREGIILGEGYHRRYGGPHAEIEAIRSTKLDLRGATAYVTLEPCRHFGKTPPCTEALIEAEISRVVAAVEDPNPEMAGRGFARLREAGITCETDCRRAEAEFLNAPYLKLTRTGLPWIHAKWAMSLDGKIASHNGSSRWISCEQSRAVVHELRGKCDAIITSISTALADDPQLTARPPGLRTPIRVVCDSSARLPLDSRLVRSAREVPVLLAVGPDATNEACFALESAGCELIRSSSANHSARLAELFAELGRRRFTHVLLEAGGRFLGACFDGGHLDELHVFIAPKLIGGSGAPSPLAGQGLSDIASGSMFTSLAVSQTGDDIYVHGRMKK